MHIFLAMTIFFLWSFSDVTATKRRYGLLLIALEILAGKPIIIFSHANGLLPLFPTMAQVFLYINKGALYSFVEANGPLMNMGVCNGVRLDIWPRNIQNIILVLSLHIHLTDSGVQGIKFEISLHHFQ